MVAVVAAADAAHEHAREAWTDGLIRHARQEFHVVVEARDVELLRALGADRLDAQRHVLQILGALVRGDDDLFEGSRRRFLACCACTTGAPAEHGAREWQPAPERTRRACFARFAEILRSRLRVMTINPRCFVLEQLRECTSSSRDIATTAAWRDSVEATAPSASFRGSSQGSKCRQCSTPSRKIGCRTCSELAVRTARSVS